LASSRITMAMMCGGVLLCKAVLFEQGSG